VVAPRRFGDELLGCTDGSAACAVKRPEALVEHGRGGGGVSELASTRFGVDVEPAVASRSLWRRLVFARLNFVGNLAAEAVASGEGTGAPTALP
jgi:hypothetical protein